MTRVRLPFDWRGFAVPVCLLIAAELAIVLSGYNGASVARPSDIAGGAVEALLDGSMLKATRETLISAGAGLLIGGGIGLVMGVLLGLFPVMYWLFEVPLEAIRPIPSVALIPIVLLIFGLGHWMEISLVAKTSLWPMFFLTHAAVRGVKPRLLEVAKLLRMGRVERVRKIVLPAAAPGIFVGFRLSMGAAMIVAVTVEIAANPLGLGYAMMEAQERLRPDLAFAYLFWVGLVGWGINAGILALQRRLFRVPAQGAAGP